MTSSYTFIFSVQICVIHVIDLQFLLSPTPADPSPKFVRDGDEYRSLKLPPPNPAQGPVMFYILFYAPCR